MAELQDAHDGATPAPGEGAKGAAESAVLRTGIRILALGVLLGVVDTAFADWFNVWLERGPGANAVTAVVGLALFACAGALARTSRVPDAVLRAIDAPALAAFGATVVAVRVADLFAYQILETTLEGESGWSYFHGPMTYASGVAIALGAACFLGLSRRGKLMRDDSLDDVRLELEPLARAALRIVAAVLALEAVGNLGAALSIWVQARDVDFPEAMFMAPLIGLLVQAAIALFLWFAAPGLALLVTPRESRSLPTPRAATIAGCGIAVGGTYVAARAALSFSTSLIYVLSDAGFTPNSAPMLANTLGVPGIQLAFGLGLFLGARPLGGLWWRLHGGAAARADATT